MYRHINTLKDEDWFNRPWVLLGTGESLDRFDREQWRDHNVIAIYDAFYACNDCDILLYSDSWVKDSLPYLESGEASSARYIATRSINAQFLHYWHRYERVVMWDYDCDKQYYGVRMFDDIQPFQCSNTSSFVTMWLGALGVKELKTFGIDGGIGKVSSKVSDQYKDWANTMKPDFDIENQGFYSHANRYGMNIMKQ